MQRCLFLLPAVMMMLPSSGTGMDVRVTGNNVNLRASSNELAEVVTQASAGQVLQAMELQSNWVSVLAPSTTPAWIHEGLLRDGKVSATKARVRSGPGTAYSPLLTVTQNTPVVILERLREWARIVPPPGIKLYISSRYVTPAGSRTTAPATPEDSIQPSRIDPSYTMPPASSPEDRPDSMTGSVPAAVSAAFSSPVTNLPSGVSQGDLVQGVDQGRRVQVRGRLRTSGFLFRRNPAFRLTEDTRTGEMQTVCYIQGDTQQLTSLKDKPMLIWGREYWVNGLRHSLVIPEKIILNSK
jgi:SH3-like domain-containing protein